MLQSLNNVTPPAGMPVTVMQALARATQSSKKTFTGFLIDHFASAIAEELANEDKARILRSDDGNEKESS